jgi:hypothetical protein
MGSTQDDGAADIAITPNNLWVAGYISNRQTNGPRSFGATDIFLSRHQLNGTQLQLLQAGGQSVDFGNGLTPSANGSVYVTGKYRLTGKFGPYEIGGRGGEEFFLGRVTNAPLTNFREADAEFAWTGIGQSVKVAPNPATANRTITVEATAFATTNQLATITIMDLTGRVVSQQTAVVEGNTVSETLTAPSEAGMYVVRITGDGAAPVTHRFSVQ